jgi:pimeloyl-ACP methyl ester carboxylesterase
MVLVYNLSMLVTRSTSLPQAASRTVGALNTRFLDVDGGRVAYDVAGTGPLVVMLPGLGDLRQEYRFLAPLLAEAGYRVATADVRGHGESSVGWERYDSVAVGQDLLALIDHLGGPAFVIGNSFSAGAAVWAATERPSAVSGLALLGPFVRQQKANAVMTLALKALFAGPWRVRAWAAYHATLFKSAKPADYGDYSAALRRNLAEPGRFEALKGLMFRSDEAIEERLTKVKAPAVVVMGSADPDFSDPEREASQVAELLGARYVMIAGVGHYPQAEAPQATLDAVLPALRTAFGDAAPRG